MQCNIAAGLKYRCRIGRVGLNLSQADLVWLKSVKDSRAKE